MSDIEVLADLTSHRIEGYAVMADPGTGDFNVPLISHIEGDLWVGGCIDGKRLPDDFRMVFSLYPWERYAIGPDTQRVSQPLYDSREALDSGVVHDIASQVVAALDLGLKTLVHCQAGLNRSNLIAALALMKRGRSADEAIALLRERRSPVVLCNKAFETWLRTVKP